MKKKLTTIICVTCLACTLLLSGCSDNSAGNYVGERITSLKNTDHAAFTSLLDVGIEASNQEFVLQFPEELRDDYLQFLQHAFSSVSFEASAAKKNSNSHYTVDLTFSPIDIAKTVEATENDYLATMTDIDFLTNLQGLLEGDALALTKVPIYEEPTSLTIDIAKKDGNYTISEKSINSLLESSVKNYMAPYNNAGELLDTKDFFQSYLDASCKGEFTQFVKHTKKTVEEVQTWYDSSFSGIPSELSEEQNVRYMSAMKNIVKQCKYTVQMPEKNDSAFDYSIDVTYSPNNSIIEAMNTLKAGTYYSVDEAAEAGIQILESYAANPVFGAEATTTLTLNQNTLLTPGAQDSEMTNLINALCPIPAA